MVEFNRCVYSKLRIYLNVVTQNLQAGDFTLFIYFEALKKIGCFNPWAIQFLDIHAHQQISGLNLLPHNERSFFPAAIDMGHSLLVKIYYLFVNTNPGI